MGWRGGLAEGEAAEASADSGEVPRVGAAPAGAGSNNPYTEEHSGSRNHDRPSEDLTELVTRLESRGWCNLLSVILYGSAATDEFSPGILI